MIGCVGEKKGWHIVRRLQPSLCLRSFRAFATVCATAVYVYFHLPPGSVGSRGRYLGTDPANTYICLRSTVQ